MDLILLKLKNNIYISLLLIIIFFSCKTEIKEEQQSAKNFFFSPSKTVTLKSNIKTGEETIIGKTFLISTSEEDSHLRWKKTLTSIPNNWHIYYCDNVACQYEFADSSNLNPVNKNNKEKTNPMKLYVEHNEFPGSGTVKIVVYDIKDVSNKDTITYKIVIN